MYKILLPVDFTAGTEEACRYALRLAAAQPQARLLLLHCHQDYLSDADTDMPPPQEMTQSERQTERVLHRNDTDAQMQLEELYLQLLNEAGLEGSHVQVERALVHGLPEEKIAEEAQRYNPDLVVMATRGETSLARNIFGTVTTKMAQKLNVPLLTVPNTNTGQAGHNILYATSFDQADKEAILYLIGTLAPFHPTLHCLHIATPADQKKARQLLAQLKEKLQPNLAEQDVHFTLLEGDDVAETLQDYVQRERIDLLALTTHKQGMLAGILHPSLAEKLVLTAEVPLLIFHNNDTAT
ncbi:universal stress protein [Pontibacter liquoris]|uniref:universal stress protein n=1 Tax=Pontibacter liquoris TaxID=2905677 RepID=UPI001FA6D3F7|nr:universal stress protein [Pontibacter liquoris]